MNTGSVEINLCRIYKELSTLNYNLNRIASVMEKNDNETKS